MEKYSEYMGEGYYMKVRKKLTVDAELLPDSMIDADINIGAMKELVAAGIESMKSVGKSVDDEKKYGILQDMALNYLCGVLCLALKSRTSVPPFNVEKYKRNWDKKSEKFMRYGNSQMMGLIRMG